MQSLLGLLEDDPHSETEFQHPFLSKSLNLDLDDLDAYMAYIIITTESSSSQGESTKISPTMSLVVQTKTPQSAVKLSWLACSIPLTGNERSLP